MIKLLRNSNQIRGLIDRSQTWLADYQLSDARDEVTKYVFIDHMVNAYVALMREKPLAISAKRVSLIAATNRAYLAPNLEKGFSLGFQKGTFLEAAISANSVAAACQNHHPLILAEDKSGSAGMITLPTFSPFLALGLSHKPTKIAVPDILKWQLLAEEVRYSVYAGARGALGHVNANMLGTYIATSIVDRKSVV